MGLHQLEFWNAKSVAGLNGKGVAVTEHTSQEDVLSLGKGEASGDVALFRPLLEIVFVGLRLLCVFGVALRHDAVAHRVECEVVEDLIEEPAVTFSPAALTDHRQAVERGQVAA